MSWKKEENFVFEEGELITFKGTLLNKLSFPVHLTVLLRIAPEDVESSSEALT